MGWIKDAYRWVKKAIKPDANDINQINDNLNYQVRSGQQDGGSSWNNGEYNQAIKSSGGNDPNVLLNLLYLAASEMGFGQLGNKKANTNTSADNSIVVVGGLMVGGFLLWLLLED